MSIFTAFASLQQLHNSWPISPSRKIYLGHFDNMCERVRLIILFYFSVYSAKQAESAVHWFVRRKARGDGSATVDKRPAGGRRQRDSHGIYHTNLLVSLLLLSEVFAVVTNCVLVFCSFYRWNFICGQQGCFFIQWKMQLFQNLCFAGCSCFVWTVC